MMSARFVVQLRVRLQAWRSRVLALQRCKKLRAAGHCLLSATGVACWERDGISNRELKQTIDEFWRAFRNSGTNTTGDGGGGNGSRCRLSGEELLRVATNEDSADSDDGDDERLENDWEPIIIKEHFQVWRKAVPGTYLYRYKIFGTFDDVPARAFFQVQMDTEYRKTWDDLVIKLEVVDREDQQTQSRCQPNPRYYDSKNEVIHWIMHYPFPLYGRDYCYIRRAIIDNKNNLMVLVSRAIDHPKCPESSKYVRVRTYESSMVIKPHTTFDENGFDYLLTYHDDPKAAFPSVAYNWMAASGVPDFVKQLHQAAYQLTVRNRSLSSSKSNQPYSVSAGPGQSAKSSTAQSTAATASSNANLSSNQQQNANQNSYAYA